MAEEPTKAVTPQTAWFASVDGDRIEVEELARALQQRIKQRFYHGAIPEGEAKKFIREIAEQLIDDHLLWREAKRRGLKPDPDKVAARIAEIDRRNRNNDAWQRDRARVVPILEQKFGQESLLNRLESEVKAVPRPDREAVYSYYEEHRDKFTRPDQVRASIILLAVAPTAGIEIWRQARERARILRSQLAEGAEFSELAKQYSDDISARQGGDMGYQHRGMLGSDAQRVLDDLEVGDVSEPVTLLDGIVLFKLTDRLPPQIIPFEKAGKSAEDFLREEMVDVAWQGLLIELRQGANITINEQYYLPATWGLK